MPSLPPSLPPLLARHSFIHGIEAAMERKAYMPSRLKPKELGASDMGTRRFAWDYQGSKLKVKILLAVLVLGGIAVCLFPVWPYWAKRAAQLVSMTLLVFMLGALAIRGLVYLAAWLVGYELWLLPNVFDDDLAMFTPWVSLEKSPQGQGWWRAGAVAAFLLLAYWVYTQPTEFEQFVGMQKDFITELYSGSLIGDVNQADKDFVRTSGVDLDAEVHEDILSDILGAPSRGDAPPVPEEVLPEDATDEDAIMAELRREMAQEL
jgi:hypothetical protein